MFVRPPHRFERNLGVVGVSYFFAWPLGLLLLWTLLYRKGDPFPWDFFGITLLTVVPVVVLGFAL